MSKVISIRPDEEEIFAAGFAIGDFSDGQYGRVVTFRFRGESITQPADRDWPFQNRKGFSVVPWAEVKRRAQIESRFQDPLA